MLFGDGDDDGLLQHAHILVLVVSSLEVTRADSGVDGDGHSEFLVPVEDGLLLQVGVGLDLVDGRFDFSAGHEVDEDGDGLFGLCS